MALHPYGKRSGLVPRRQEDYGDGAAFPEILVAQYPLDMGRGTDDHCRVHGSDAVSSLTVDAVVRRMENALKIAYSSPGDAAPKSVDATDADENGDKSVAEATARTNAALQMIVGSRLSAAQPANARQQPPTFIKYQPAPRSASIIRMMIHPLVDPLQPPKYKHRRLSRSVGSTPVPVMSSPPRPPSRKDQSDWKVPPCVSNWNNPKGYSIPLDQRLASDGRRLPDVQISDAFTTLAESLYAAEMAARAAVRTRHRLHKELWMRQKVQRERELRQVASKARAEKAGAAPAPPVSSGKEPSEQSKAKKMVRRRRLVERALAPREVNRGTRVSLGMASTGVVDPLLAANGQIHNGRFLALHRTLYGPNKHGDSDILGDAGEKLEKISRTDKGFSGAPATAGGKRERPVEFDDVPEPDDDPFDLDQFLTQFSSLGMDDLDESLRSMLNL